MLARDVGIHIADGVMDGLREMRDALSPHVARAPSIKLAKDLLDQAIERPAAINHAIIYGVLERLNQVGVGYRAEGGTIAQYELHDAACNAVAALFAAAKWEARARLKPNTPTADAFNIAQENFRANMEDVKGV